jgi:hypothetical protein
VPRELVKWVCSGWEIIGLMGSAGGAGAVNAVAGGGTLLNLAPGLS